MPDTVKTNEPLDPLAVGLLGPAAVVTGAKGLPHQVREFRLSVTLGFNYQPTSCFHVLNRLPQFRHSRL
jgi:hypothetical protein